MGLFENGPPAEPRGLALRILRQTGHFQTIAGTSDGGGGLTSATVNGGTIPCRVDPLSGNPSIIGARLDANTTHIIHVLGGSIFVSGDHFVVDGRGTFQITAPRQFYRAPVDSFEVFELD